MSRSEGRPPTGTAFRQDIVLRRWLRRFTLGAGPLKRPSDRLQAIGRLVVVLSFVVAPPLGVAAATVVTAHLEAVAADEAADRSPTRAVLIEDAPAVSRTNSDSGDSLVPTVHARATWSAPGGKAGEGLVRVRPLTPAATAVPVWVDRDGHLVQAPLDRSGIARSATAVGVLALVGVPLATWTLYAVLCFVLDNRRERRWERDWAVVEPEWSTGCR